MATLNNVITNANGCVGIGTSSPAQLLELKKTTGSAIALLNYNDSVKFNINASSAGAGYVGMVTNHDLIFVTNDTERARLNTNGNIGIGTSSPAYKLEVLGLVNVVSAPGSYGAMFRARDSVTLGTESFGGVHFTSNPGTDYTIGKWTTAAGAGLLQIRDQSGNKFFTIDGAGNVGIGTTTLSSLLTLHGTYPQLVANNPSTGSGVVIQLKDNGRDAGFMGHSTTTARLQFGSRGIANTQMTLDYNGNLGIGTTSPTRKLHIDGGATTTVGIYIDANGISGTDIEQSSDAFRFQIRDNIPALFYTNNTERIRIASDGNVGIGTSSPVSKLHLDDATAPYITITRTGVPTWQLRNNFPVNQYGFSFNNTTAGTTPLFIGAGGNIGIGTSGPTNRLDVVGGSGTTFNMSNDGDSQRGGKLTFISSSATGRQFYVGTTSAIYNLVFGIDSVEKARIDTAGNVGINTTSPSAKLHVSASASTTAGIFQGVVGIGLTPTSAVPRLQVYGTSTSNAESRLAIYTSNTGTAFNNGLQLAVASDSVTSLINYSNTALYFGTNSTERMRITSTGNVGIGTTSPGYKLDVLGDLRISGSTSTIGTFKSSASNCFISLIDSSGDNVFLGNDDGDFLIQTPTSAYSTKLIVKDDGNVGIGTTSPSSAVSFNKVVEAYDATSLSYQVNSGGTYKAEFGISSNGGWLGTSTAHDMRFASNGAERMRITSGGNVGIGTTVSTEKLSVEGSIILAASDGTSLGSGRKLRFYRASDGWEPAQIEQIWTGGSYQGVLAFKTNTGALGTLTTKMVINNDGNLGIGTTSPTSKLDVTGGNIELDPNQFITFNNAGTVPKIGYRTSGTQAGLDLFDNSGLVTISIGNQGVGIGDYAGGNTLPNKGLAVSGNVGIGTTSPLARLHVTGSSSVPAAILMGNVGIGTTSFVYSNAARGDVEVYGSTDALISLRNATANSYIQKTGNDFYLNNGGAGFISITTNTSERMRITSDGNVGIGTSSPGEKLGILNGNIQLLATSGDPYIRLTDNGVRNWYLKVVDTSDYFEIGGTNATSLVVKGDGNVGIGTTSPTATLDVSKMEYPSLGGILASFTAGTTTPTTEKYVYLKQTYTGAAYDSPMLVFRANANSVNSGSFGTVRTTSNGSIAFSNVNATSGTVTAVSEKMRIQADGYVGIGTTSPAGKLHIVQNNDVGRYSYFGSNSGLFIKANDNSINNLLVLENTEPGANYGVSINFNLGYGGNQTTAGTAIQGSKIVAAQEQTWTSTASTQDAFLAFYTALNGTSSEKVRITSDGNVGIGTTKPTGSLSVIQSNTYSSFRSNGSGAYTFLSIGRTASEFEVGVSGGSNQFFTGTTAGDAVLKTLTGKLHLGYASAAPAITVDLSNNVGIGTTSPGYKLEVTGTGFFSSNLTANGVTIGASDVRSSSNILTLGGTSERIRIDTNGNVGIGTTSPAYKLEVNGSLYATRLSGSAMFTTSGKGRFYGTASYALAAPAGSSLTGQTDSATPFETSLGYQAGNVNTGTGNTAIGYQALLNNTTGTGSIAIGYQALYTNTRGKRNIAIGYEALRTTQGSTDVYGDPIGDENVAIGYQAARAAFNINRVVAIGHRALANNLAGGNVAIGWRAMESNVGTANSNLGILNTAVGTMALFSNTSGNSNSAFGYNALTSNITGNENTAVGHRASLYNSTGKSNGSFGSYALYYNQVGNNNNAFGNYCLYTNGGNNNSAFGHRALYSNTTGTNNCAFGSGSLWKNTSGTKNTAIGGNAGSTITTGGNLSVFGYNAQASSATATNEVTLGNASVATLRCQVTTITALSDFRDKTDINNVEVGLSFVEKLRPVTFKWDKREWYTDGNRDGSKKDTITQIGFIAQELKALQESENATYLNLVYESNPDKLEATPGNLLIPLIKAVQELNAIVKQQRVEFDDKIAKQQLEIDYLKSKLNN